MYNTAIIGVSGARARGHAEAYRHISKGQLVAVSSRQEDKLKAFQAAFGITAAYRDYHEMLAHEQLDLVHVNTPPNVRLEILEAAEAAGVPLVVLEKPLAIQSEDYLALVKFSKHAKVKVAINHQLHFHPRRAELQRIVREGAIGKVRFIDASSGMNMAFQGTHTLQAIAAFNPDAKPLSIMGQISGPEGLAANPQEHYAPDALLGSLLFDNGVSAQLRCGSNAPRVNNDARINTHKRIAVYGTTGQLHWSMWNWQSLINGKHEQGTHDYPAEDILGQAALTEAMFDWLEAGSLHPLNLNAALQDVHMMLKLYMSAIHHQVYTLDDELDPNLIASLGKTLA